jgi:ATP-dependent Clp protease, protease subunit
MLVPVVIETTSHGERSYDIYSRLHKDRIILLGTPINADVANVVVAQLLHLNSEDQEAAITLFLNSPGGSVSAGLAILDTINYINAPVHTVGFGIVASMAAILLAGGKKGKRSALTNAEIMIHQPWGGVEGTASDIAIQANQILKTKKKLNQFLSDWTGKPLEQVEKDTDRDNYMSAAEALEYGLIDRIVEKKGT